jgi:hypothetical protein
MIRFLAMDVVFLWALVRVGLCLPTERDICSKGKKEEKGKAIPVTGLGDP